MAETSLPSLGIDVSKAKLDIALKCGDKSSAISVENNPAGWKALDKWLKKQSISKVHACMEATNSYAEGIASHLHDVGHVVSVVNPACTKAYAQCQLKRTKTDAVDALLIASFCETQHPAPWQPPSPEIKALRQLTRLYDSLQTQLTQTRNRSQNNTLTPFVKHQLLDLIDFLSQQILDLKNEIIRLLHQFPALRLQAQLLSSIPGIGDLTAAKILSEIPDINLFQNARQLAAYAGLTPAERRSGSSIHGKPHLSKLGNSRLRRSLFMPALVARLHNPLIQKFISGLLQHHKHNNVINAAIMHKLIRIIFGVLKHNKSFDPNFLHPTP